MSIFLKKRPPISGKWKLIAPSQQRKIQRKDFLFFWKKFVEKPFGDFCFKIQTTPCEKPPQGAGENEKH